MPTSSKEKQREYSNRWYRKNRKLQMTRVNGQRRLKAEFIKSLKLEGSCIDCGEDDWRTLDFDHVRGEKEFDVSRATALGIGWDRLKTEIQKCELRCANCHRKRTWPL